MREIMGSVNDRWRTPGEVLLEAEVLQRLATNRPLTDLNLREHEGRIDLRGLRIRAPERSAGPTVGRLQLNSLSGLTELKNVSLTDLDLSGAHLDELRLLGGSIRNCRFEQASCRGWRLWAVTTHDTSFHLADLRDAVLGGALGGREDTWHRVTFSRADMRGIVSAAATYVDCDFSHARLDNVDFDASVFVKCIFAGRLSDVIFNRNGRSANDRARPVTNEMVDVDFSGAELHYVEFRGLDLDRVTWAGRSRSHSCPKLSLRARTRSCPARRRPDSQRAIVARLLPTGPPVGRTETVDRHIPRRRLQRHGR
jgi:uncharacterized protein YjbI with pentapeptide repeats